MAAMQAAVAVPVDAERASMPAAMAGQLAIKNKSFFGADAWIDSQCSFNPEKGILTIQGPGEAQPREVPVKGAVPRDLKMKGGKSRRANRFDITLQNGEPPLEVAADSPASKVDWVIAICGTAGGDLGDVIYEDSFIALHANGILVKNYYWGTCEHKFIWYADIKEINVPEAMDGKIPCQHGWGVICGISPMALVMRNAMGRTYQDVWFAYNENPIRNRMHYIILVENGSFRKGFAVQGTQKNRIKIAMAIRDGCVAACGVAPASSGATIPDSLDDLPHTAQVAVNGVPVTMTIPTSGGGPNQQASDARWRT
jgi:hypothetical protein